MVASLVQDVRYALRQLHQSPGSTLVTVLALGLGANIAGFTLMDGILLRPLPYAQLARIVTITRSGSRDFCRLSYANMLHLRDAVALRSE